MDFEQVMGAITASLEFNHPRREQTCKRKVRYGHVDTALRALAAMQTKGTKDLEVYPCPHCKGYHLGHKIDLKIYMEMITNDGTRSST